MEVIDGPTIWSAIHMLLVSTKSMKRPPDINSSKMNELFLANKVITSGSPSKATQL